jgi:membrane-associated protease RseP (regulator of RpoE activity)
MRPIPALLCVAALAAAPASAVAGPSNDPRPTVETFSWSTSKGRLGVMVMSLTPELRKHFGAPDDRGVLVAHVEPGTPATQAGIEVGDVIVEVRGRKIDSAADVLSALDDVGKGEHVKITVLRDRMSRSVDATLTDKAPANASWSAPWLRDWMKPFDEPTWFGDWPKPLEPMTHDTDSASASSWLRKLRELFAPKNTESGQRS